MEKVNYLEIESFFVGLINDIIMNQNRFKMKRIMGLTVLLFCGLSAFAQSFEVDGIFYNIESSKELTVSVAENSNKYSGRVIIPSEVSYSSKKYKVVSIGKNAFHSCSNMTSISLPNTIKSICEYAFQDCTGLNNVIVPESVTTIGNCAFCGCSSLKSISLPQSVISLGSGVFAYCGLTEIFIPDSIKVIPYEAFRKCPLVSITMGKSVKEIQGYAFRDCEYIKEINIKDLSAWLKVSGGLQSIFPPDISAGNFTFYLNGKKITNINIPEDVDSIGDYIFFNAHEIKSITFHDNVKYIGEGAFCSTGIEQIILPNSVISIGGHAFYGCSNLKYVSLGEVKYIGESAFSVTGIEEIIIPNSVVSLGRSAFGYNKFLKYVSLGENVDMIKCSEAFYSSVYISKVHSHIKNPSHILDNVFSSDVYKNAQLIVPDGCLEKYLECDGWMNFVNIVEESQIDGFSLKITTKGNGSVSYLNSAFRNETKNISVKRNQSVTLAITPDDGYKIKSVLVGGKDVTDDLFEGTYTIAQIKEDIDFYVEFAERPIYLSIQHADNGRILQKVEKDKTYECKIVPNSGWKIHSITFNGEDVTSSLSPDGILVTPVIVKDASLNVTFEEVTSNVRSELWSPLTITVSDDIVYVRNARKGELIEAFTLDGNKVCQARAVDGTAMLTLPTGKVYIIKGDSKTIKVGL